MLYNFADFDASGTQFEDTGPDKLFFNPVESREEFERYWQRMQGCYTKRLQIENRLSGFPADLKLLAYNQLIDEFVEFDVRKTAHYRETILCPKTNLICRQRAVALFLFSLFAKEKLNDSTLYVNEQASPFFKLMRAFSQNVVGSEYLGANVKAGQIIDGIRHEDICQLSFPDNSFDSIITMETLEHVVDYECALNEIYRCSKNGANVVITAPLALGNYEHIIRAEVNAEGRLAHLLSPEYHNDPGESQGILCYRHFGWKILDELRNAGFREAKMVFVWSLYHGLLGQDLPIIYAQK